MLRGSMLRHKLDNQPEMVEADWAGMVDLWRSLADVPRHPLDKDGEQDAEGRYTRWPSTPAICPAEYPEGSLRRKAAVLRWHWFAADIDNDNPNAIITVEEMVEVVRAYGLAYVIHGTTKSRAERHRYRLILPISRPIEAAEYEAVWASINAKFFSIFDNATRDPSRLFFVPARWKGAHWAFEAGEGEPLDIDRVTVEQPVVLPPKPVFEPVPLAAVPVIVGEMAEMRAKLLAQKHGVAEWGDVLDPDRSPFVSQGMRDDYRIAQEGGRFFKFMARAAARAIERGYPITAGEVERLGLAMDAQVTGKRRHNSLSEAGRALQWATANASQDDVSKRVERNIQRLGRR